MRVGLLFLDSSPLLDEELMQDLTRYLQAMLHVEVETFDVPEMPIAPKGWQALMERARQPLKSRPGRPGSNVERQLNAPQLLECMKALKKDPARFKVPELEGVSCILGLTNCEFFYNTDGLLPDDPCPEDRTSNFFAGARESSLGACSLTRLDGRGSAGGPARRKLVRQLLPLVSSSMLELLGLRCCQSHTCLAYRRPFSTETTGVNLCYECEDRLLRLTCAPAGGESPSAVLVGAAADRCRDLREVLFDVGSRLDNIKLSRRSYYEFEEDFDWLHVAEEILRESAEQRPPKSDGTANRRLSLLQCLRRAHEEQPHRTLKRTFTQPLLTRTCLLDMMASAPYRHNCGDMTKWSHAVINRKHEVGGHYVEMGGTLRGKKIGAFVESGLNASLAPSGQARLKTHMETMPATWKEQRAEAAALPPIRARHL